MFRAVILNSLLIGTMAAAGFAQAQSPDKDDKKLDIRSSAGDLHVGNDADAQKAGLPLYPGARLKKDEHDSPVNLGAFTEAFGMKLVVAKYDSNDAPGKIIDFYREQLKKYGKVLECHTTKRDDDADVNDDDKSEALKCEGANTGPVTELKVGTQKSQHVVAIEPHDSGTGATFDLVYVHLRGKEGDI